MENEENHTQKPKSTPFPAEGAKRNCAEGTEYVILRLKLIKTNIMFKRLLLILIAVICTSAAAKADDRSRLGFKSHILTVRNDFVSFSFNEDGELYDFDIPYWGFSGWGFTATSKGYKGECTYSFVDAFDEEHYLSGTFEATVTGGHITEIRVKCKNEDDYIDNDNDDDVFSKTKRKIKNGSAVIRLNYLGSVLQKASVTESWTEEQVVIVSEDAPLCDGPRGVYTYNYKHTENYTISFKNYEYDEEGKWISRSIIEDGDESEDNCRYTFTTKYICEQQWKQCLESGQLKTVEDFAKSDSVLTAAIKKDRYARNLEQDDLDAIKSYRDKAAEYWNAHILDEVAQRNANDVDALFTVAQNPIVYPQVKDAALELINKQIYDRALAETDFQEVENFINYKIDGTLVLKDQYRDLIQSRATQLRNDSIAHLEHSVSEAYDAGNYADAAKYCRSLLEIDRSHSLARQRLAEAELELIKQTPAQTLKELREKCKTYQQNYAYANDRCNEVGDLYVSALLSDVSKNYLYSYIQEIDEVARSFRMSDASKESLQTMRHQCQKKLDRRDFRDSMFHGEGNFVGVKVGAGIGGGNGEFGWLADANLRFGRMCNWFNIVVGGRYVAAKGHESDKVKGRLSYTQFVIPAELRWNFYRGEHYYNSNYWVCYLGAGAECHLPLKGAYAWRIDGSHEDGDAVYKESERKKEYLGPTHWAPRLSLGVARRHFEFEVFGSVALQSKYNTELLQHQNVDLHIGKEKFDQQTEGRLFIGTALRLGF